MVARRPGAGLTQGHLPGRHAIDGYRDGGFTFGGMSHRGSILCLPSGIYGWSCAVPGHPTVSELAPALAEAAMLDLFLIGLGDRPQPLAREVAAAFRDAGLAVEGMTTAGAASTYTVLLGEGRRVGAALTASPPPRSP